MQFINRHPSKTDRIQGRLLSLAALLLLSWSIGLSLAPAVRLRSWTAPLNTQHWLGFGIWVASFLLIHFVSSRLLPGRDPLIIPLAALLTGWGVLTIWRVAPEFGLRQSWWLALVSLAVLAGMWLPGDLRFLRHYKYLWLTGGLLLTALTLLLGTNPSGLGPRLWLGCCGVYFQPSEPLKLLLIVYLAAYLADRQFLIPGLLPLLMPTLFMAGLTVLLLLVQRDLGTASIFLLLYATLIFFATGRTRILVISLVMLLLAGLAGTLLYDVVRLRMEAWINPWLDPSGRSYQIVQSLFAVAAGGLFGRGPGIGSPTVVPVQHSDFIFASIAEETGLLGTLGLLALIGMFIVRGLKIALTASDSYRRYLAIGLTAYLGIQTILIVGGNLRLLPLTGVTLPFVSYGGSSLLTSFLAFLFLLHISASDPQDAAPLDGMRPTMLVAALLISGLAALALVNGWWAFVRGPDLLARTDNPRRIIASQFVPRGAILDRRGQSINTSVGEPGSYARSYHYSALGPVAGYIHPTYGQAGLEDSLDGYLRGLEGTATETVWRNSLLYGTPPPGLDVRLSLDLELQAFADAHMGGNAGAAVLLNAETGEILIMASYPGFDPNALDENWPQLIQDPAAPLLNRAALGQYPAGAILSPLLFAAALEQGELPSIPQRTDFQTGELTLRCAFQPETDSWGAMIQAGCPGASATLGQHLRLDRLDALYGSLGVFEAPQLRLAATGSSQPAQPDPGAMAAGEGIQTNPLHLARLVAALSTEGRVPGLRIATAVRLPGENWRALPALSPSHDVIEAAAVRRAIGLIAVSELPLWQSAAAIGQADGSQVVWFIGGTLQSWQGTPLSLALVLENAAPGEAQSIGLAILQRALEPSSSAPAQ